MQISPKLPRVYIVEAARAVTGSFVCAKNMASALHGTAEVFIVLPRSCDIPDSEFGAFAGVHRIGINPLRRNIVSIAIYVPTLIGASLHLRLILSRAKAQALVINDFYMMHGVLCRLFGFRGRLATWVRIDPLRFPSILGRSWLWLAARTSDKLVSVSKFIQGRVGTSVSTDLIYDVLSTPPAPSSLNRDSQQLCYIGNYIPGKGQDQALRAFAAIAGEFPKAHLNFYGGTLGLEKNRQYLSELRAYAVRSGIRDRVTLNGYTDDVSSSIEGSWAVLNFSQSESFSMTVLEAQGSGVAVITTASGGPVEIVDDSRSGIVVPVDDLAAMASAIRDILSHQDMAIRMGHHGRSRVLNKFNMSQYKRAITELLDL